MATIALEDGWSKIKSEGIDRLERMLDEGFSAQRGPLLSNREFMTVYQVIYRMATQRSPANWSEQLYARHGETIKAYLGGKVLPHLAGKRDVSLLSELALRWDNHKVMNKWMANLFRYLDTYYVRHHNLPFLLEAGLAAFKTKVFDVVKTDVTKALLAQVNLEREGNVVDRSLLKRCIDIYVAMGENTLDVYDADFQQPLLQSTLEFYSGRAVSWVNSDNVPTYLGRAEEALLAENGRVQHYMHESSDTPLLRVVEGVLLADQQSRLIENDGSGIRVLLREDKREDLARAFRLFSRVPEGLVPIARVFREHYQDMGLAIVREREGGRSASAATATGAGASAAKEDPSDPTFVQALLDLHEKAKNIVNTEFSGNTLFQKALKDAFEVFVNKEVQSKYSNAEMIATYVDRILKSGGDKMSDSRLEEELEKVVQLFAYVADKDIFGEIYRNQLSKRILNQRSVSSDAERSMISKLKLRCGAQYTSKMEGMLNDLTTAETAANDFTSYIKSKGIVVPKSVDFTVQVLTTGFWPSFPSVELRLPADFVACQEIFKTFYAGRTQHRKLEWVHALGTANVRGSLGKATYEFSVTTLQAVCLVFFNNATGPVGFEAVREALGSDPEVVKRVLHSLSCGKYKVLMKSPENNSINTSDSFTVNGDFTCPLRKIRIPMASLEETHNAKRVEEDRSLTIEACIVRIMKARKAMPHQALFAEVMAQLHFFKPNPKVIKRRIEHLIEREYLERDTADPSIYKYLA